MCGRSNIGKGQYVVIYSECISSKYFSTKGGGGGNGGFRGESK